MRVLRAVLVAVMVLGLAPTAAQAHATKSKTKIVFLNKDEGGYGQYWSLDTTSVPPTYAKARLLRYSPSARKWVGYGGRRVKVIRYGSLDEDQGPPTRSWSKTTNRKGYFTVTMNEPLGYTVRYPGSKYSLPCAKSETRFDEVQVRRSSTFATSSVDATHTRLTIATDYEYNPFVAQKTGHVGLYTAFGASKEGSADVRWIYLGRNELLERPFTGRGHAEFSFVYPVNAFNEGLPFFMLEVDYPGAYSFSTEDYDDTDPWFY